MAFDYGEMVALATELIGEFGQTGTLSKAGVKTGVAWNPTFGSPTTAPITFVDLDIIKRSDGETLVAESIRTLLIAKPDSVIPSKGDRITIGGTEHMLGEVKPLAPAGVVVFYEAKLES